jgi:predicted Rossmann-fold nucleotide-binding protein
MYECCPAQTIEIESADELRRHIETTGHLDNAVVQGLDLRTDGLGDAVRSVSAENACFLGCKLAPEVETHIQQSGGIIFPAFVGVPFNAYRAALYTPNELMDGYKRGDRSSFSSTTDGQIYAYYRERKTPGRTAPVMDALAFRIHDHAIDDALHDLLFPPDAPNKRVVGVMGGHQMRRDTDTFLQVARITRRLTRAGYFVATGGGPGAMEAANLGAYLSGAPEDALTDAVATLAPAPHYTDGPYFDRAYAVLDAYPDGTESLAVPTWFYGHEPSNLFASHIAKYFANSIREDGLLAIAHHGIIYAPGSAGTIQEVFMDAAQNHYASLGTISPMVFFGEDYWTEQEPVYPLLQKLAAGHTYADLLTISDEVDTIVDFITAREPLSAATDA